MAKAPFKASFCATFESGQYRGFGHEGQPINYHQIEASDHALLLEEDYRIAREQFGITKFRDGAWLEQTFRGPGTYDWTYLDKLADVSQGQSALAICHYEWPAWVTEEEVRSGDVIDLMSELARAIAERYTDRFSAYYPIVEATYWTTNMTRDGLWWPAYGPSSDVTWWKMYQIVGTMFNSMARAIKDVHPTARIGMSEPWNWFHPKSFEEFSHPFDITLGRYDAEADIELGMQIEGGHSDLLDIIGMNVYGNPGAKEGWPLHKIFLEARKRYPEKEIIISETSHGYETHLYTAETWATYIDTELAIANASGANIHDVYWAPFVDYISYGFEPLPGGLVRLERDGSRLKRHWDPELATRFKKV